MRRALLSLFLICTFLNATFSPLYAYTAYNQIPEYLCDLGMKFYQQGRYNDALTEFKKVLVIQPGYELAIKYIKMVEEARASKKPLISQSSAAKKEILGVKKSQTKIPPQEKLIESETAQPPSQVTEAEESGAAIKQKKISLPKIISIEDAVTKLPKPIEIEQDRSITIAGKEIQRFLLTQPDILTVEKNGADELLLTGKNVGYTYLHVWDDQGRNTLEFLTVPLRPEGPTVEEEIRLAEEGSKSFKLRYALNWSSFESGKKLDSLRRSSYSWSHTLNLLGETPYGNFDSGLAVNVLRQTTDLTYLSFGLRDGKVGPFKNFSLYGFDFTPGVSNLSFGGVNLRGVTLRSPVFNKKLEYNIFWGREGRGQYGGLSPGLSKIRNSFYSGADIKFSPFEKQSHNFSVVHGWGRDRLAGLNDYGYAAKSSYSFDKWGLGYDVGYDSIRLAYLLNSYFNLPKLNITTEFRDIDKNFKSISGAGSRQGEFGLLNTFSYEPIKNLTMTNRLDVFKDRLFPNPNDPQRYNEEFSWGGAYRLNPITSLGFDYSLQNELGRVAPFRSHIAGLGLSRTIYFVRKISTYLRYRYGKNQHFTSSNLDYSSNKILAGLRFNLIGDLSYFLDKELAWIEPTSVDGIARPSVLQTGVEWSNRIFNSPFYGDFRFMYRDEENAASPFSFLSGEDYIEGYSELSYRPNSDLEVFANTRVRNIWAENPTVNQRIDVNFYAGMRYTWDTGVRWESSGDIEGYVFKDANSDGLRQRDEAPMEGIKIWCGKDNFQVTDLFGYYKFKNIRARKAHVTIDTTTVPAGLVLTVPGSQEAAIEHGRKLQINFGISSRTEISGLVFEDFRGTGIPGPTAVGVQGVSFTLENGIKATTDNYGRFAFKNVAVGKHKLTLDLKSVPGMYIPTVPIFKEIEIQEGTVFTHNIPLKKTQ